MSNSNHNLCPKISVIIPTLNAEKEIGKLLDILQQQTFSPDEILVIDSSSDDRTAEEVDKYPGISFLSIDRADFNHGTTRDLALSHTKGDIVCFLTQDAVPASKEYLEMLISPMLDNAQIALVSGRQLPKADARLFEKLVRKFNYPDESAVRDSTDLSKVGIKTFFASDVCSCYQRKAYLECGGFGAVNTNEDMLMAARFIAAGYKVAYEARARVYHSHNFTLQEQYKRNKEIGYFLEMYKEELMNVRETGEGIKLIITVSKELLRQKRIMELMAFGADCIARLLGNRNGRLLARYGRRSS